MSALPDQMKIDDHIIPTIIVDALCNLVDTVEARHILEQARLVPSLFQGHRPIIQNVHIARQHIKSGLKSERNFDPSSATILRTTGLYIDVVIVLSEEALSASFTEMATFFGEADFIAATLLDERERVRQLAHNCLHSWDGILSDEAKREAAGKELRSTFRLLFSRLKELIDEALPVRMGLENGRKPIAADKTDKALVNAKAELARVTKQSDAERKQLQGKLDQKQKEFDRIQIDLNSLREAFASANNELAETRSYLSELQSSLEDQVEERLSEALSIRLRGWLEPGIAVKEGLEKAHKSSLVQRAKDALEKQRLADLHYGNRDELARLLEQRQQIREKIDLASASAMHPLPELKSIAEELRIEIEEIERRLGIRDTTPDPTASGLLVSINSAQTLDQLSAIRQFIHHAAAYSLLSHDNLNVLYRAMEKKAGMIYDKAEVVGEATPAHQAKRFFLRHAVLRRQPFTLFIDGHNVLYQLADIFRGYFVEGRPEANARIELANRVVRACDKSCANVLLYFDGSEARQQALSDQVRVFYSGGSGEHRADEAILNHLMLFVRSEPSTPVCLVTKDADFARQAAELGATILHPEEFAEALDLYSL
jgi:hypothetical protein